MGANNLFGVPNNADVSGGHTKLETSQSIVFSAGFGTIDPNKSIITTYRIGDRLIGRIRLTMGTVAASVGTMTLPRGLTINKNLYRNLATGTSISMGKWTIAASPGGAVANFISTAAGVVFFDGADDSLLYFSYRTDVAANGGYLKDTMNAIFASASVIDIDFDVPIAQWSV